MKGVGCHRHARHVLVAWVVPVVAALRFAERHAGSVVTPSAEELQHAAFQAAWNEFQKTQGVPPPMPDPHVLYTLKEALIVRDRMKRSPGFAGLIPPILANEVAQLAANRFGYYPPLNGTIVGKRVLNQTVLKAGIPSPIEAPDAPVLKARIPSPIDAPDAPFKLKVKVRFPDSGGPEVSYEDLTAAAVGRLKEAEVTPVNTTRAPDPIDPTLRKVPRPPTCPAPLPELTHNDLGLALAPYKPAERTGDRAIKLKDGGLAWPLRNEGWYFQYPDMVLRMLKDGSTSIRWTSPPYAVDYDANGIVYYTGRSKVQRTISNDVMYQDPSGTVRQEGDSIIYHWCAPNAVVYQTPVGTAYYDDGGVTYRSGNGTDVTHYAATGEVLYQGAGGITRHDVDGNVTHWTRAGAVFQHADGNLTYTPVGETAPRLLDTSPLGPDPFPGPALTASEFPEPFLLEETTLSKKLADAFDLAFSRQSSQPPAPAPAPATNATNASNASNATNATSATNASNASNATNGTSATIATNAEGDPLPPSWAPQPPN